MATPAEDVSHIDGSQSPRASGASTMRFRSAPTRKGYPPSRRSFLRGVTGLLALPAFWLMHSLTQRDDSLPETRETSLSIPLASGNGIRFFDNVIVVHRGEELSVFSSKCTHLGCRIQQAEGNEIVCPCHGSRFNMRGQVVHGPATRGLQPLNYSIDRANAVLHVTLVR